MMLQPSSKRHGKLVSKLLNCNPTEASSHARANSNCSAEFEGRKAPVWAGEFVCFPSWLPAISCHMGPSVSLWPNRPLRQLMTNMTAGAISLGHFERFGSGPKPFASPGYVPRESAFRELSVYARLT